MAELFQQLRNRINEVFPAKQPMAVGAHRK